MKDRKPEGVSGGTFVLHLALIVCIAIASVLAGACSWLPNGPTTTQTVVVTQTQNPTPGPSASPAPGAECGGVTSLNLGTFADDYTLQAGGTDSVKLVVSFYQNLLELPATCTDKLTPTFTATGSAGCAIGGPVSEGGIRAWVATAANAGTCSVVARLPAIPPSNAVDLTVEP